MGALAGPLLFAPRCELLTLKYRDLDNPLFLTPRCEMLTLKYMASHGPLFQGTPEI